MRCVCCDRPLNDFETTRKYKSTGDYADLCNKCVTEIGSDVEYTVRREFEPFVRSAMEIEEDRLSKGDYDE